MADKKQFDDGAPPAGSSDPSDLDPFAELSRIIGYNPRPQAESEEAALADAVSEEESLEAAAETGDAERFAAADPMDDFGIDLERELLGDLAAHEPVAEVAEPVVTAAAQADEAINEADFDTVEEELDLGDEDFDAVFEPQVEPVSAAAEEAPVAAVVETVANESVVLADESIVEAVAVEPAHDDIADDIEELNAAFAHVELDFDEQPEAAEVEITEVVEPEVKAETQADDLDDFNFDDVDFGDIEDAIGREMDQAIAATAAAAASAAEPDADTDLEAAINDAFHTEPETAVAAELAGAKTEAAFDADVDWAELDAKLNAVSADTAAADAGESRDAATTAQTSPGAAVNPPAAALEDPFEALAKMAERYQIPQYSNEPARPAPVSPQYRDAAPDVETTEIYDRAYSVADDLDLPEVAYDEPAAAAASEIDLEFDNLLNEMSRGEPLPKPTVASAFEGPRYEPRQPIAPRQQGASEDFGFESVFAQGEPEDNDPSHDLGSFDFDDADEDNDPPPPPYRGSPRGNGGRNMMIAAIVGGIAVLGGLGAIAMSWTGGSDGAPVLVTADGKPVKIRPENPGGSAVPNKDATVYDVVSRTGGVDAPSQERLVSNTEDPIALPQPDDQEIDDIASIAKGEDRIDPSLAEEVAQDPVAVAPRKVRTVVVRSDGTLAPAEAPADETTNTIAAAEPAATVDEVAAASIEEPEQITTGATTPSEPAKVAAVAGGWSVQIASQPSEAGATKSLKDISRRYSGVIGDRGSNIVKAEVPGKGTFWRVRLAAASRDDAVSLCSSLKSAGGSCFVTR